MAGLGLELHSPAAAQAGSRMRSIWRRCAGSGSALGARGETVARVAARHARAQQGCPCQCHSSRLLHQHRHSRYPAATAQLARPRPMPRPNSARAVPRPRHNPSSRQDCVPASGTLVSKFAWAAVGPSVAGVVTAPAAVIGWGGAAGGRSHPEVMPSVCGIRRAAPAVATAVTAADAAAPAALRTAVAVAPAPVVTAATAAALAAAPGAASAWRDMARPHPYLILV